MGEKRYIISDAAKMVDVESHVLRYWEDELDIVIPRNEMGHRYYTDFHILLLKNIKELKEVVAEAAGKNESDYWKKVDIRFVTNIEELNYAKVARMDREMSVEDIGQDGISIDCLNTDGSLAGDKGPEQGYEESDDKEVTNPDVVTVEASVEPNPGYIAKGSKLEQFQLILSEVVSNALKENNGDLGKEVSEIVSDNVIKEMDYLMHIREKQEEERFKKLDETIRNYQNSSRERAKSSNKLLAKLKRL